MNNRKQNHVTFFKNDIETETEIDRKAEKLNIDIDEKPTST